MIKENTGMAVQIARRLKRNADMDNQQQQIESHGGADAEPTKSNHLQQQQQKIMKGASPRSGGKQRQKDVIRANYIDYDPGFNRNQLALDQFDHEKLQMHREIFGNDSDELTPPMQDIQAEQQEIDD